MTVDPARVPVRELKSGALMPAIGLGTFGSDRYSAKEVATAVAGALEVGYRHFDCASVYENEAEIGHILDGFPREQLWLTSKLWNDKHAPQDVRPSCEKSLSDLRVDYLDAYLVHWPFPNHHDPGVDVTSRSTNARPYVHEEFMATWRQMERLVDEGLVRHIGTSNMTIPKMKLLLRDARIQPAVNEMELHPHFQQPEFFSNLVEKGIQPIGFCPIGSPDRPDRDKTPEDTVDIEDPVVVRIAKDHGVHPAVVCVKWAVQRGQTPIPFSVRRNEYESNLENVVKDPLTGDEMAAIAGIDRGDRLIKGHVFLWREGQSWEDLWDLDGVIKSEEDDMVNTRRRVWVSAPDVVEIVTEPVPTLAPGETLVRFSVSGICGSDKAGAHGEHAFFKPPYYPGHEVVGVVVEVGGAVQGVAPGDRVTVEPTLICGHCKQCLNGHENLCENLEFFGCGFREGGMADVFAVRADRLHKIPSHFSDYQAALIEPLATPVHAVRLVGDLKGKVVAVLGSGTIGLLTMIAARHGGARKIVSTDPLANKRQMALDLGADAVIDATTEDLVGAVRGELGGSVDAVFDCVSHQDTFERAIKMAIKGGTVAVVGGPRRPVTLDLPVLQEYQIRLQGCATYEAQDFVTAAAILDSGMFDAARLITSTFPLLKAADAFAAIASGREAKILVVADAQ